jgi:hypothetical protein
MGTFKVKKNLFPDVVPLTTCTPLFLLSLSSSFIGIMLKKKM